MFTKKIITAVAVVLMAALGTVGAAAPAQAGGPTMTRTGGWCC